MIIGRVVAIVLQSFLQCFMLCSLFLQLFLISCIRAVSSFHDLYSPWVSIRHHWCQGCQSGSRVVIMTQVLLLFCCCHFHYHHVWPHLAPCVCCSSLQETPLHRRVQALACKYLSESTKAGTLLLCTLMSLSPSTFPKSAIR